MSNGAISRLSAFSDILIEDGKRRLSKGRRESKISLGDLEARTTDIERRTEGVRLDTLDTICKVLGEFVGTALLLFFACMGLIPWPNNNDPKFVGGLVFGLTIMFVIQVVGAVSGAHINPAVTLASLIYRKITIRLACMYVVAQFLGAIVGFGSLKLLTPGSIFHPEGSLGTCSPAPRPDLSAAQIFFFEYFATTVLIAMCCAAWDPRHAKNQDSIPVKFGLALSVPFIAVSPATGCCINPARAFAPAMYNGDWEMHWAYWIAPLLAATVTTVVYRFLFYREAPPEKKDC